MCSSPGNPPAAQTNVAGDLIAVTITAFDAQGNVKTDYIGPVSLTTTGTGNINWIEHLGLGKVVAVGHSSGGMTVVQLAAAYPDRVAAIVMVASAKPPGSPPSHI